LRSGPSSGPYGVRCAQQAAGHDDGPLLHASFRGSPPLSSQSNLPLPFSSMVHGSTHHHPWTVLTLLRPSTDHSALVVIGRRACRRHGPWTRRTHRPVEAELGSNACKTARSNIPRIMHRTASACHRRIASGVQKAPAATQWTLLTFLTSDNEHSSRSIQRFHWRPPSGSERDHTTTLPIPALREKNSAASATATKSAIHACTILVRAVHGDRRARRGRLLVARSRTVRVRPKRTAQHSTGGCWRRT
jgi:hypothetical protein